MSRRNLTATPPSSQAVSMQHALNTQGRMSQLLDEEDHKRCSEGNHRALLAENLDHLRSLATTLKAEDWKYATTSTSAHPGESDFAASGR